MAVETRTARTNDSDTRSTLRTIIIVLPTLTFRTYQILPHTDSYFDRLYSCLDLLPPGLLGYPRGAKPPWYPRKTRGT